MVYVRYEGFLRWQEGEDLFADYMTQPEATLGQKQLVDLSRVEGYERDFAKLMALQADKAGTFLSTGHQFFMVFVAPTPVSQDLGRILVAPWKGVTGVVTSLQYDEAGALAILGQPEDSIADMLRSTV
ncbi:MAG: hypothetical protein VX874_18220 [Pseudomonadota bacterium]|nr:hypothetical protein [Pseudomonadota bacterium]